ncbi:polyphosphoinositide phosphatase [[Candida] anglica]|uniref:Polyphosphoinositide phosphatase n=1 Tax=[Candida] anglica TaxID=148631 RepID=A0ABP0EHM1_9ASCO
MDTPRSVLADGGGTVNDVIASAGSQQRSKVYANQRVHNDATSTNYIESEAELERGASDDEEDEDDEEESQNAQEFNNKRIVLQRFTIYNSLTTMYIVGSNAKESLFRILEICKDPNDETKLDIIEDKNYFYTRKDMVELINGLNESVEGGIYKTARGYGLLGLIKFTKGYYLSLITKCSQVAILGGHFLYHVDETKLIPLDINYKRPDKYSDEERLLSIFKYLDLGKTFYFSYSYDITNTLQTNFIRQKKYAEKFQFNQSQDVPETPGQFDTFDHNERFVWNKLLIDPVLLNQDIATYEWFQPIIHGFIDQANISIYGKKIYITIIARRSHHFAGARFLKRGVNDKGNVANEIETEQIVSDMLVSSFHDPKYGFYGNPRYTSFVQHRGSIPLYWTQDLNRLPKPPIEINLSDPFYQSSAIHFNNLFERYGSPVIVLNLIKTKEKVPRESKLNEHFVNCVKYLNQFLPEEHRLQMHSFDMSKHSKKNLDVIGPLQSIAAESISRTGFFHNGVDLASTKVQKGVLRTNCIDCLDRTNAAQFIVCKEVLVHQLSSLGLISKDRSLDYDSDLINILTEIFHDHGDTIAIQYGGSNLVNTMDSYRRINQWSSHTRDMLNSIKRIYSNSFMDSIRQEAINLFLGNYSYDPNKPKLWELQNDFYLHNDTLIEDIRIKVSYVHWFNDVFLKSSRFDLQQYRKVESQYDSKVPLLEPYPDYNDNWFNECYVPRKYQSFTELFQFNMNSNARYFPSNINNGSNTFDYSPFESRKPYLRPSKSIDALGEQPNGNGNVKYLESSPDDRQDISMHDIEEDEGEYESKGGGATNKSLLQSRQSSSTYLNITHSNKIKSFLTTKIEKLGYSSKQSESYSEKSTHTSYLSTPRLEYNSVYSRTENGTSIYSKVAAEDKKLYMEQSRSSITLPSSNLREHQNLDSNIDTKPADKNIYDYYTNRLIHGGDLEPHRKELYGVQKLDIEDVNIYSNYLGVEEDALYLYPEDNYFT